MSQHGEYLFDNAQQARSRLQDYGFHPFLNSGISEHWVRGARLVTLSYEDGKPANVPLANATGVWFVKVGDDIVCSFD